MSNYIPPIGGLFIAGAHCPIQHLLEKKRDAEKAHVFFIRCPGGPSVVDQTAAPPEEEEEAIDGPLAGSPVRYEYYYNKCPIQSNLIHGQHERRGEEDPQQP